MHKKNYFFPLLLLLCGCGGGGNHVNNTNHYRQTNLVASDASFGAQQVNPNLIDAWGLSLRPGGAGGHWWIAANKTGTSIEYVGDVNGVPLHQDALAEVSVPSPSGGMGTPTGIVFNVNGPGFVITQSDPSGGSDLHGPARFLFATDTGLLTAWTERANSDGTTTRPHNSVVVRDDHAAGAAYFGLAISPTFDRLYVADFGQNSRVVTLDDTFTEIDAGGFVNPFPGYAPFNVQTVGGSVFVAYAKQQAAGAELHGIGLGRLAEFTTNGTLIAVWNDRSLLNAPWGIVKAPDTGFGVYSGKLLVGNFGNGTIVVFDPSTRQAVDYLRGSDGNPIVIDGLWDMKFGNGVSLGEADALYFAAGPHGEGAGLFGKLKFVP